MRIKKCDKILLTLIIIFICTYIMIITFSNKSEVLLMEYAKNNTKNIMGLIINNSLNNILYKNKESNYIIIEKDNEGKITNLNFDTNKINKITYILSKKLFDDVKKIEEGKYNDLDIKYITNNDLVYFIPIGIIHDNVIFNNLGPKIPFKIELIGNVDIGNNIELKDYGINSFIVEVYLNINLNVGVILPFKSENVSVSKNILLESKIVQGQIPQYYGGIITKGIEN